MNLLIGSQIVTNDSFTDAMIRLQLFSSRVTDSNDPFRASLLQWTELSSKNREILWVRETDAVKSKLLMSNFRINY